MRKSIPKKSGFAFTFPILGVIPRQLIPVSLGLFGRGEVSISEEYLKAGSAGNLVVISGRKHYFSIPISGRIWIIWHAIIHVFSYSKSAVDFIVPIILSVAALSVIANRLLTIYLPDF